MRKNQKTATIHSAFREIFSVVLMTACLLFLTAVNFFLYPQHFDTESSLLAATNAQNRSEELPAPIPTEEKSTESGLSLMEELLHEHHLLTELTALNKIFQHIIAEADKLQIVHFELLSPPPEM